MGCVADISEEHSTFINRSEVRNAGKKSIYIGREEESDHRN
jgi:hypothetical protein